MSSVAIAHVGALLEILDSMQGVNEIYKKKDLEAK